MKIVIEGSDWGEIVSQMMTILFFGLEDPQSPAMPEGQQTLEVEAVADEIEEAEKHSHRTGGEYKHKGFVECGRCGRIGHNRRTCTFTRRISSPRS